MSWDKAFAVYNGSAGEFIGAGVSRNAYRLGGEVYKVENPFGSQGVNYSEAAASAFLRENFKIPGVLWPNFIIHTMPDGEQVSESIYVPATEGIYNHPMYKHLFRLAQSLEIGDLGVGNVRMFKNFLVPIDLGYWGLTGKKFWDPNEWVHTWERRRYYQDWAR